jgi:hypothetical protein
MFPLSFSATVRDMDAGFGWDRREARIGRQGDGRNSREREESRRAAVRRRIERLIEVQRQHRQRTHRHRTV